MQICLNVQMDGGRFDLWQPHHSEGVEEPDQAGDDRNQQCHLQGAVRRVGVDAGDFVLNRLCWPAGITSLASVMLVKLSERTASSTPPAIASPNESPKEPAAELTPAASLIRSSSIGASV